MMNNSHNIEQDYEIKNGVVQVPLHDYEALLEHIEELKDIATLDQALLNPEETFPGKVAIELLAGTSPVRVYRQHRKLTQEVLAQNIGVSKTTISEIENGRKTGSLETLKALASALSVDLDDLV